MNKTICVYCSSSNHVDQLYFETARELGAAIANFEYNLIYGGAHVGLMGAVAESAHKGKSKIIGVLPRIFKERNLDFKNADEFIVTHDLRERKAIMEKRADAFIALPGGFGTLEEVFEVITLKQIGFHNKPIVLINSNNFYQPLKQQIQQIINGHFANEHHKKVYFFADNVDEAMKYIHLYFDQPPVSVSKDKHLGEKIT